ncbi:hypothetical protein TGPRC2_212955 [Toxoplasma gondii TgCatPRC2]|uniref:Uncharacterized protein n=1 Tax=Toxoplasma gondii TgCatPRC2 TaxID=1130821 RepID=A0A151HHE1_TOXGO|nr:hypothetical protein TGPRC2_212955 [Toxoplasma gondii TgCatPRC2]
MHAFLCAEEERLFLAEFVFSVEKNGLFILRFSSFACARHPSQTPPVKFAHLCPRRSPCRCKEIEEGLAFKFNSPSPREDKVVAFHGFSALLRCPNSLRTSSLRRNFLASLECEARAERRLPATARGDILVKAVEEKRASLSICSSLHARRTPEATGGVEVKETRGAVETRRLVV